MTVPTWVTTSVGIYALLGSIFMLVGIVVAAITIRLLLDVRSELRNLSVRVEQLTTRMDTITKEVQMVTQEVSVRASGILRMVDDAAGGAIGAVQKFGPALLVVGALARVIIAARGKKSPATGQAKALTKNLSKNAGSILKSR